MSTAKIIEDINARVSGKDVFPMAGEYTATVMQKGLLGFLERHAPRLLGNRPPLPEVVVVRPMAAA